MTFVFFLLLIATIYGGGVTASAASKFLARSSNSVPLLPLMWSISGNVTLWAVPQTGFCASE